jgi:hypothetical protein
VFIAVWRWVCSRELTVEREQSADASASPNNPSEPRRRSAVAEASR